MGAQSTYRYGTVAGAAGGIVDTAPYAIDSFRNENNDGVMKFGMGVVKGTNAGVDVKVPVAGSNAAAFEGVVTNNRTTEYDLDGNLSLKKGVSLGVMRYGRIYVRVATGATPEYGDALYLVKSGDDAGCFTDSSSSTVAVKGRFLGGVDSTAMVAPVELFNQAQS